MSVFDPSCFVQFTIPGDTTNIYLMLDESIVTAATAGLSNAAKAAVNAYRFVPTTLQMQGTPNTAPIGQPSNGVAPVVPGGWAGNDPPAIYFKAPAVRVQAALARWYK